jgi:pilus assembly protein CpaE
MIGTLLVTPDAEFEARVKRVFDGDIQVERWWDDKLPRTDPQAAAHDVSLRDAAVVVLGPGLPPAVSLALAEALDVHYGDLCVVLVAKPSARLWEQALRAGVREVIGPEADDNDLRQSLVRAGSAASRRLAGNVAAAARETTGRGRLVAVLSPKGGAGKTTVASNLAAKLAASAPGRVVIVDLDLQFGDVASAFALGPQATIADAARADVRLDSTALKVFLEPHPSGVYALLAPHFPAEADEVSPVTTGHVLDVLASEFAYVIVDTAAGIDEHALAAVERADDLVFVCVTDVPSVRALRKAIDVLDLLGMTRARRHLVLNRSDDRVGLSVRDVEATLGLGVDVSVPTSRSVQISVNQGSPIVESDPRSPAARALTTLAERFVADPRPAIATPAPAPAGRRFSRKDAR